MKKNALILPLAGLMIAGSAVTGVATYAKADTTPSVVSQAIQVVKGERPVVMGTITAIQGTTLTITDKKDSATYTIEAGSASILKHEKGASKDTAPAQSTVSLSTLVVGDMVAVRGTLNGTTVTATTIMTGDMRGGHGGRQGHGVHGVVSAVAGSTLTVTGADGKVYTVDASGATASKVVSMEVGSVVVGDTVRVDGTLRGTTVTAKHIMDGVPPVGAK